MADSMPNTLKYQTSSNEPNFVHFWERELINTPLWFDWIILKTHVHFEILREVHSSNCTLREASHVMWSDFIAATCGDKSTTTFSLYAHFIMNVDDYHFAYWLPRLAISSDMFDGFSETQSRQKYGDWIDADPKNSVYYPYRVTNSLKIIHVGKRGQR